MTDTETAAIENGHVHRRPQKNDFENKTIIRFESNADNIWRIWFSDGTAFAIQAEVAGLAGVPYMELCEVCATN